MIELLHEVVNKRESKARTSSSALLDMLARAQIASQQVFSQDTRGQSAIDIVMRSRDNISIGSTINIPRMDINATASTGFMAQHIVYAYTGDDEGTYRGWVRTN